MKEKFAKNMEESVSHMEFLLQIQATLSDFFCLSFYILRWFLGK